MKYLLDTHILLWAEFEPEKLSKKFRHIISDKTVEKYISSVSVWEISLKYSLAKLELGSYNPETLLTGALQDGYLLAETSSVDMASFCKLPNLEGHKDPFVRMLVWQAIRQDFALLTSDSKLAGYQLHGLALA